MQRFSKFITKALPSLRSTPKAASPTAVKSSVPASTIRSLTTTTKMAAPTNAQTVIDLIKSRRTYYPLSKDLTVSKERIQEIVKEAVLHVPSSFNAQSNRVVVLFGEEHEKFWNITTDILKAIVPEDKWESSAQRMGWFKGAAGTVLFFIDETVVQGFQANIPLYADRFPTWATQSDAMLQHTLWVALEAEGLGANLQHYNPLVDEKVAAEWKLPATWTLSAQLVFGGKTGEAGEKAFQPIEERVKVFGA